jgi:REP element-mobilizing transposase RayT
VTTGYKIYNQSAVYYLTLQVVSWLDIFTRQAYRDVIIDSLDYCRVNKGLTIHAYVIMSNHIHLIVSAKNANLSDVLRDFKRHTSKRIINLIQQEPESRKDWLLFHMQQAASVHKRNENFQLWTHENHALELESNGFIEQKLDYIHQNPVRAGLTDFPCSA